MSSRQAHVGAQTRTVASVGTLVPGARGEHISLESEPELGLTQARPAQRKVRFTYSLKSALRGCFTELAILDDHFIAVRMERPGTPPNEYLLDLRFANAKPVRVRRVAWNWLALSTVFAALTGVAIWLAISANRASLALTLGVGIAMLIGCAACTFVFLRRTTESLQFTSMHGQATLISITGGIGSARAGKVFFVSLIKSIGAAKAARPQPKPQFLRDEMREHHRLRELGVLSEQEYEMSKARILAAHS